VLFKYPIKDTVATMATQIRDAVPSPNGKQLAFTVLNRLYVMGYPNGTPKRLTKNDFTEAQPVWNLDGNGIYFTTWSPDGGNIRFIDLNNNTEKTITKENALYQGLAIDPTGKKLIYNKTNAQKSFWRFYQYEFCCWWKRKRRSSQLCSVKSRYDWTYKIGSKGIGFKKY
jgi:dipeptidyl aminopeptidase/acylaminoacyl peptidase